MYADAVEAQGVPLDRRLGQLVKVPEEELAFVNEETLAQILSPEALNSGNVVDIYQQREEDFLAVSTLEVSYQNEKGQKIVETVFVDTADTLDPLNYPRICVSARSVKAMHRAIQVLTRKVDNLTMTLRTCREHYYKELFFLRHGRPPEHEHEVYWFNPKAYEDTVTKEIMRTRLSGREKELQEELDEKERELEKFRLKLSVDTDDDMPQFWKVVSNMPLTKLFKSLKSHNFTRQEQFYNHMERTLNEWKGKDGEARPPSPNSKNHTGGEIVQRLEAAESQVKQLQEIVQAANTRNAMLCKQVRNLGGVPGLVEPGIDPAADLGGEAARKDAEDAARKAKDAELEARRKEHKKQHEEEKEKVHEEAQGAAAEVQDLKRQVGEQQAKAEAWEAESKKLMQKLVASQKELQQTNTQLTAANNSIEKLWFAETKAFNSRRPRLRNPNAPATANVMQDHPPGVRRAESSQNLRPADSPHAGRSTESLSPSRREPDRRAGAPRPPHQQGQRAQAQEPTLSPTGGPSQSQAGKPARRPRVGGEASEPNDLESPQASTSSVGQGSHDGSGTRAEGVAEERCACGADFELFAAFCSRCGVARKDLQDGASTGLPRRRPRSLPPERGRQFCVSGVAGRRDDWWRDLHSVAGELKGNSRPDTRSEADRSPPLRRDSSQSAARRSKTFHTMRLEASRAIQVTSSSQTEEEVFIGMADAQKAAAKEFGEFLVFNGGTSELVKNPGLLFCTRKARSATRDSFAPWGMTVIGIDEGDGWVRVGDHFLPKKVSGVPVLLLQVGTMFTVCEKDDTSVKGDGLFFQSSKHVAKDQSRNLAAWRTLLMGVDEGDGWLRVGSRYLPKELGGEPVLELQASKSYQVLDGHPELDTPGLPYFSRKRLDTATNSSVPWGSALVGCDEGDGWVRVGKQYLPKRIQGRPVLEVQAEMFFVVCDAPPGDETEGIPVCTSKTVTSQYGVVNWGSTIRAIDQGFWVKVGDLYVPKYLNHVEVLHPQARSHFAVWKPAITRRDGVPYCNSKVLQDSAGMVALWGKIVLGVDEGDGWVRVSLGAEATSQVTDFYLPKQLEGIEVLKREEREPYIVCKGHPEVETQGLPYCEEKELHSKYAKVVKWGGQIRGIDEGDGWVKVGDFYLPQEIRGHEVLRMQELEDFMVCEGHAALDTPGLPLCTSRDLSSRSCVTVPWGSRTVGIDDGSGWASCGAFFLPKVLKGTSVLAPKAQTVYRVCDEHPSISDPGPPFYLREDQGAPSYNRRAPWGTLVTGWDHGDGWIKVKAHFLPKEIGGVPVLSFQKVLTPDLPAAPLALQKSAPGTPRNQPGQQASRRSSQSQSRGGSSQGARRASRVQPQSERRISRLQARDPSRESSREGSKDKAKIPADPETEPEPEIASASASSRVPENDTPGHLSDSDLESLLSSASVDARRQSSATDLKVLGDEVPAKSARVLEQEAKAEAESANESPLMFGEEEALADEEVGIVALPLPTILDGVQEESQSEVAPSPSPQAQNSAPSGPGTRPGTQETGNRLRVGQPEEPLQRRQVEEMPPVAGIELGVSPSPARSPPLAPEQGAVSPMPHRIASPYPGTADEGNKDGVADTLAMAVPGGESTQQSPPTSPAGAPHLRTPSLDEEHSPRPPSMPEASAGGSHPASPHAPSPQERQGQEDTVVAASPGPAGPSPAASPLGGASLAPSRPETAATAQDVVQHVVTAPSPHSLSRQGSPQEPPSGLPAQGTPLGVSRPHTAGQEPEVQEAPPAPSPASSTRPQTAGQELPPAFSPHGSTLAPTRPHTATQGGQEHLVPPVSPSNPSRPQTAAEEPPMSASPQGGSLAPTRPHTAAHGVQDRLLVPPASPHALSRPQTAQQDLAAPPSPLAASESGSAHSFPQVTAHEDLAVPPSPLHASESGSPPKLPEATVHEVQEKDLEYSSAPMGTVTLPPAGASARTSPESLPRQQQQQQHDPNAEPAHSTTQEGPPGKALPMLTAQQLLSAVPISQGSVPGQRERLGLGAIRGMLGLEEQHPNSPATTPRVPSKQTAEAEEPGEALPLARRQAKRRTTPQAPQQLASPLPQLHASPFEPEDGEEEDVTRPPTALSPSFAASTPGPPRLSPQLNAMVRHVQDAGLSPKNAALSPSLGATPVESPWPSPLPHTPDQEPLAASSGASLPVAPGSQQHQPIGSLQQEQSGLAGFAGKLPEHASASNATDLQQEQSGFAVPAAKLPQHTLPTSTGATKREQSGSAVPGRLQQQVPPVAVGDGTQEQSSPGASGKLPQREPTVSAAKLDQSSPKVSSKLPQREPAVSAAEAKPDPGQGRLLASSGSAHRPSTTASPLQDAARDRLVPSLAASPRPSTTDLGVQESLAQRPQAKEGLAAPSPPTAPRPGSFAPSAPTADIRSQHVAEPTPPGPGPRLDLPVTSEVQRQAGLAGKPPIKPGRHGIAKPTDLGSTQSSMASARTTNPSTWLPLVDDSRAGSAATARTGTALPTNRQGSRPILPKTENCEVQTLVGFEQETESWSVTTPHPSMQNVAPEAYHLSLKTRVELIFWCLNFLKDAEPDLVSDDLIDHVLQRAEDDFERATGRRRSMSGGPPLFKMVKALTGNRVVNAPKATWSRPRASFPTRSSPMQASKERKSDDLPPINPSAMGSPRRGDSRERTGKDGFAQTASPTAMQTYVLADSGLPQTDTVNDRKTPVSVTLEEGRRGQLRHLGDKTTHKQDAVSPNSDYSSEGEVLDADKPGREVLVSHVTSATYTEAEGDLKGFEELEGGTNEQLYAPLGFSDMVSSGWPGFVQTDGGSGLVTARSSRTREKRMNRGKWRHEVSTGGISFRDSETILTGKHPNVVVTPPLQGADPSLASRASVEVPKSPREEQPQSARKHRLSTLDPRPGTR